MRAWLLFYEFFLPPAAIYNQNDETSQVNTHHTIEYALHTAHSAYAHKSNDR